MCFLTGWEGNIERQQGTSRQKKKKTWNAAPSNYSDGYAHVWAKMCASRGPPGKTLKGSSVVWCQFFIYIHKKAQLQIQEATLCCETSFLYLIIVFLANKVSTSTGGKGGHYFVGIVSCPILYQCFFAPIPAGPPVLWAFTLPPGEKGSSALETLCVGLAVSSLRCSGCFNNYWGHLDEL